MTEQQARIAVAAIVKDLSDRRGLRQEWEQIDDDIREEIRETWAELIVAASREEGNSNG